ncbi:schlafen family member 13-like [Hoplias malabaricus]|uniref:schlafen family member 13-like n=1 Tax=Hoplias malabaricus TaxID=27720 RepID=UPI003462F443
MALSKSSTGGLIHDQHFSIRKCKFGELPRKVMDKIKKEQQRDEILHCVCALLNSGGGVISAEIENTDYIYTISGLGADLEESLTKLLDVFRIEDFIEFVQDGNTLHVFVKSWCQKDGGPRLCSIDSGLRERSGSCTPYVNPNAVLDFIKKKHQFPLRQPLAKRSKRIDSAQMFFDEGEACLNQSLDFGENVNVEFKSFESQNNLEKRLKETLPKYISAFANTKGGILFIGVDDKTKKVVGCGEGMSAPMIEQMMQDLCKRAKTQAVHLLNCTKKMNLLVEPKYFNVKDSSSERPRYVLAFKIQPFCCAVFEDDPKCWHVDGDRVARLKASVWLEKMQFSDPDHEFIERFKKVLSLKDSPPQCRPVYSTQNIAKLQERIFSVPGENINIISDSIPQELLVEHSNLLNLHFVRSQEGPGVMVMSTSWAVDINLPRSKDVICEALLITIGCYPTLYAWVERGSPEVWQSVSKTAFNLKQKLVNLGGYRGALCVIPSLVDCQTGNLILNDADAPPYPDSYILDHVEDVKALLQSLTIVALSFTSPLSDTLGCEFFNLLTEKQHSILNGYTGIKHLFIHGPPGSGKTLIAMEKIQRIKNTYCCEPREILYLCENAGLRETMRKQRICLCETRASFMKTTADSNDSIKHIIVDEGQNFRVEDGDWYKKATHIMQGKHGVFWIFADYLQRTHTVECGLPCLESQEKAYLSEVVRNSKNVFRFMSQYIDKIADNSKFKEATHLQYMRKNMKLSHSIEGKLEIKDYITPVEPRVVKLVNTLLRTGHSAGDIAVLYSTTEQLQERLPSLQKESLTFMFGRVEEVDQDKVVLDTIRRFSGLERNIVIVVDPVVHPFQSKIQDNVLLSAFSRARIRLYVLKTETHSSVRNMFR